MYDPLNRAKETARVVCKGDRRKYYRFRPARFYGGIATADCLGCPLRCIFCWSWHQVIKPEGHGRFYSPQDVSSALINIARKKRYHRMRISGNEPTIAREHLIKVIEGIPEDIRFILETNGILIGHDKTYAEDLARFKNLFVRISLKGCNEEEFSALTGAEPYGFTLQVRALENLCRAGVNVHPAVMVSFSPMKNISLLQKRLGRIDPGFSDIEIEELTLYGDVEERLREAKMLSYTSYPPQRTPLDQV